MIVNTASNTMYINIFATYNIYDEKMGMVA